MKKLLAGALAGSTALILGMAAPASAGVVPHVHSNTLVFPTTSSLSFVSVTVTQLPGAFDPNVLLFGHLVAP
jgi:hypothetical protein